MSTAVVKIKKISCCSCKKVLLQEGGFLPRLTFSDEDVLLCQNTSKIKCEKCSKEQTIPVLYESRDEVIAIISQVGLFGCVGGEFFQFSAKGVTFV